MEIYDGKNMKWLLNRIHKGEGSVAEIKYALDWCTKRIEEIEVDDISEEGKIIVKNYYRKTINILNPILDQLKTKAA